MSAYIYIQASCHAYNQIAAENDHAHDRMDNSSMFSSNHIEKLFNAD